MESIVSRDLKMGKYGPCLEHRELFFQPENQEEKERQNQESRTGSKYKMMTARTAGPVPSANLQ